MLNNFINTGTGRCVSLEAVSVSILSTPGMGVMDVLIFAWYVIHEASRRRGEMAVAVLTLPRRAHSNLPNY